MCGGARTSHARSPWSTTLRFLAAAAAAALAASSCEVEVRHCLPCHGAWLTHCPAGLARGRTSPT